jgi:hypothetical protein
MRRREFIAILGSAALCVPGAPAQQQLQQIRFLHPASPEGYAIFLDAVRQGLRETDHIGGQNVTIEYRRGQGCGATTLE